MKPLSDTQVAELTAWLEGEDDFVFLETSRVNTENHHSLLFAGPLKWLVCTGRDRAEDFLRKAEDLRREGYFVVGWIAYEFGYLLEASLLHRIADRDRPIAVLGVFKTPCIFDHQSGSFFSGRSWPCLPPAADRSYQISRPAPRVSCREYLHAIDRIKEYIAAGDTYQVNYTLKLGFSFSGSQALFYQSLRRNQSVSFGAWIRQGGRDIMSFSPELFCRVQDKRITVRPMKGTMARGRTLAEDNRRRQELRSDHKNQSENVMIVDLLRNDLARLLYNIGGGMVRPRSLFDVEAYETLLQMTSTIDGTPDAGRRPGLYEMFKALFPCGSVTGAPKIRTMEIIHELEKEPRGVYCGAIGYAGPEAMTFNVPIRTLTLENGRGEMGVGSGIIADSDPDGEWRESLLKGDFLTRTRPDFQLIETLLWRPGSGYWLLDEHLRRLGDSGEYFLFSFSINDVQERLKREARRFVSNMRVRLVLHHDGRIETGATPFEDLMPLDPLVPRTREPLPVVVFSSQRTNPENVYLYHKTTERELYDRERHKALNKGYDEVLFTNIRGEATEGGISTLFIEKDGRLLTPPVKSGLLPGTLRRFLLDHGRASERVMTRQDVLSAQAVYTGNSVRGLVRVKVHGC